MNKKVCVVGAGYWGKNHIKTLDELGVLNGIVESLIYDTMLIQILQMVQLYQLHDSIQVVER